MSYSFFNDKEFAGPGPLDVLRFWDRSSRQLRIKPRIMIPKFQFPNSQELGVPTKAEKTDALEISKLWNVFYSGPNWKFNCKTKDVESHYAPISCWIIGLVILMMWSLLTNT